MPTSPDGPPTADAPDGERRALDLAVQDPRNRVKSAVKLARELGVDAGLISGRRDDSIRIRYLWPAGGPLKRPMRLRDLLGRSRK